MVWPFAYGIHTVCPSDDAMDKSSFYFFGNRLHNRLSFSASTVSNEKLCPRQLVQFSLYLTI